MGNSYRLRATPGRDQNLTLKIDQDFEQLEILSLKIKQSDVYTRMCADTGIIAGRVFANNGYGIPNAKVSVFIPITDVDLQNPNLSALYPYKNLTQINEDGYAYNILPYLPSYPGHVPTGTFPSRLDVLTNATAIELYDKYYKFTVKTNDSGDFMIYGAPVGTHTLVLNLDLSDMGPFSLGPQDLVRMGMATEEQINVDRFKSSENFKQLPQIVVLNKVVEVEPFWGEEEVCQIGITRMDFDITNEANINLQPTAIFMGSMMSSSERTALKPTGRARKVTGQLCRMITGPGEIIALRQTINQDSFGLPIIERASLPNGGKCIDGDGTWLIDLPMNLDYVYTDEFGNQVLSNDPTVGVPTKAKYRFKIKWQQSKSLSEDYKRGYWLVPNIREKGWDNPNTNDPTNLPNTIWYKKFQSSYAFSYDWSAYTWDTANVTITNPDISDAINCVDTFYEFTYNKVYTVSMFMDNYRRSNNRQRFLAIKRIDDDSCDDTVNRYPVNDAYFNAGILWRILNILIIILSYIMFPLLFVYHVLAFVWNVVVRNLWTLLSLGLTRPLKEMKGFSLPMITYPDCDACDCGVNVQYTQGQSVAQTINNLLGVCKCYNYSWSVTPTPSITNPLQVSFRYTDCNGAANVKSISTTILSSGSLPCSTTTPVLIGTSTFNITITKQTCCDQSTNVIEGCIPSCLEEEYTGRTKNFHDANVFNENQAANIPDPNIRNILAGYSVLSSASYGLPISSPTITPNGATGYYSESIPFAERINLFNTKSKYYDGLNIIEVSYMPSLNPGVKHYDNVLVFILKKQTDNVFSAGTMFTFVSTENSKDPNVEDGPSNSLNTNNLSGTTVYPTNVNITYGDFSNRNLNITVQYNLQQYNDSCKSSLYIHRSDIEYFQVITGLTISEYMNSNLGGATSKGLRQVIEEDIRVFDNFGAGSSFLTTPWEYIDQNSVILICQRGVDPYSPFYTTQIGLGRLFGKSNFQDVSVTIPLRLNIPIQNANDPRTTVCFKHNTPDNNTPQYGLNLFYPSYFFTPDPTGYQSYPTDNLNFYSELDFDSNYSIVPFGTSINNSAVTSRTSNPPTTPPQPLGLEVWGTLSNQFYSQNTGGVNKYNEYESIVGGSYMYWEPINQFNRLALYFSKIYDSSVVIQMSDPNKIIVRSDRLPSGDNFTTTSGIKRTLLLQQNNEIKLYTQTPIFDSISSTTGGIVPNPNSTLSPQNQDDQSSGYTQVLDTFDCANMKQLGCYSQGSGFSIVVDPGCTTNSDDPLNHIKNGCYTFMVKYRFRDIFRGRGPIFDFFKFDAKNYFEYFYRLRLNFALCQDVFGTMFHNNWVNGNLFSFPIKINTFYNSQNQVSKRVYPTEVVVLHDDTNNFYYRSSPYNDVSQTFIGINNTSRYKGENEKNINYPTTIINLGPKYSFLKYIVLNKEFDGYNIDKIDFTSYKDLEDIINLFVLTRMINPTFLTVAFGSGQGSITNFYSRPAYDTNLRYYIDGDAAQAMAINSQLGVIAFDDSFYSSVPVGATPPSIIVQLAGSSTIMGIFFQSSDDDMQTRDYVSPMRIIIGQNFAGVWKYETIPHNSQLVPNYKWNIQTASTIFGTQLNDWDFSYINGGFYAQKYQELNRITDPYLGKTPSPSNFELGYKGYLTDNLNNFSPPLVNNPGIVGAPWYFYFGLMKGNTALNKFYTKYVSAGEINE